MKQFLSVKEDLTSYLTTKLAEDWGYTLTVTGHSMGAAIASIAATAFRAHGFSLNAYTYGQPRTGDQAYADHVDLVFPSSPGSGRTNMMARSTHANDGVAQVPTRKSGYRHHSTEIWIPPVGAGTSVVQCDGQEPPDCNQRRRGKPLNHAHFSYYGISIADPLRRHAACKGSPRNKISEARTDRGRDEGRLLKEERGSQV